MFQKNIQSSDYHRIRRLVVLWPRLCRLVDEFIDCHSYMFLISVLGNVIFSVFCSYLSLILLPQLRGVMTTVLTGLSLLCVHFYCDVGHTLQRSVSVTQPFTFFYDWVMQELSQCNLNSRFV